MGLKGNQSYLILNYLFYSIPSQTVLPPNTVPSYANGQTYRPKY